MISNEGRRARAEFAAIISYPTSASGMIVSLKNQEILLDLADFALQEQAIDNLMVAKSQSNSRNCRYTMIHF